MGSGGDGTGPDDRSLVSLVHRETDDGPQLMVVDATPGAKAELAARALLRADVIGTPLATQVFELIDAIYTQDGRFY